MEPVSFLDQSWYWYSQHYPSSRQGWKAWQVVEEKLSGKDLDLGIYRHGPEGSGGKTVTCISRIVTGVLQARGILRAQGGHEVRLGEDWLGPVELEALIARRIRAVNELLQKRPGESGSAIFHHLGQGRQINPDGTFR